MTDVATCTTAAASPELLRRIRCLLDEASSDGFTDDDWQHALGGWHVVATAHGQLVAHAAVVPRTLEFGEHAHGVGYVEAVATAPAYRRAGHGSRVLAEVGTVIERGFGIGVLSTSVPGFYERAGWERWRGPSFVRVGDELVRMADEDAVLMVLRGTAVELTADRPHRVPVATWRRLVTGSRHARARAVRRGPSCRYGVDQPSAESVDSVVVTVST